MSAGTTVADLCDPARCTLDEAIGAAKRRAAARESYYLQIVGYLRELWHLPRADPRRLERALCIALEIAPLARVKKLLRKALERSAVRIGMNAEALKWFSALVSDDDPRVRANAVESLWGKSCTDVQRIFRGALTDSHHRVAANAVYGLYLVDSKKNRPIMEALIAHAQPRYRGAAAWVVGRTGDPELLPLLRPLIRDKIPKVKRRAFHTLALLRARSKAAAV